jgi:hypothetical protein
MDEYVTIRRTLDEGLSLLLRLRKARLDEGLAWVLPHDLFPLLRGFCGTPVHHADVERPMLVHEFETG